MAPSAADMRWLERAVELARGGILEVEPNPPVGAVVVNGGTIVGEGFHAHYGGAHAEVEALTAAGGAARGATLYVSLEPCSTHGKTPPCTAAILAAGIARVVYASPDPSPANGGRAAGILTAAGVGVEGPVATAAGDGLLESFVAHLRRDRPYVIAKWAMSLDGRIAARGGDSRWITGEESRAVVHRLRGRVDAIGVGSGTVLRDRPRLTARPTGPAGPRTARRVVFDRRLRIPLDWPAIEDGGPGIVVVTCAGAERTAAFAARGVEIIELRRSADGDDLREALRQLRARGVSRLLVEGGAALHGSFFDVGAVDQVCAFTAPIVIGGTDAVAAVGGSGAESLRSALRLRDVRVRSLGGDVLVEGRVGVGAADGEPHERPPSAAGHRPGSAAV